MRGLGTAFGPTWRSLKNHSIRLLLQSACTPPAAPPPQSISLHPPMEGRGCRTTGSVLPHLHHNFTLCPAMAWPWSNGQFLLARVFLVHQTPNAPSLNPSPTAPEAHRPTCVVPPSLTFSLALSAKYRYLFLDPVFRGGTLLNNKRPFH